MSARRIVGLDFGSVNFGVAEFVGAELVWASAVRISGSGAEHPGLRWQRLRELLLSLNRPSHVAYEEVLMHVSNTVECQRCGRIKATTGRGRNLRCARCRGQARRVERMNVKAAHAYGAGEGLALEWACSVGAEVVPVHTTAVKLAALGKGGGAGTGKPEMLAAARERWAGVEFETHDAADAAFTGLAAAYKLGWAHPPGITMELFEEKRP